MTRGGYRVGGAGPGSRGRGLPIVDGAVPLEGATTLDAGALVGAAWPHRPTVEWQVCGQCNYDCSYCIQSKKHRVGVPDDDVVERCLALLAALPGRWEVKTSGGEPFSTRLFLERIVPALARAGHIVSTLTNLSAPAHKLLEYVGILGGNLGVVSASLHLEHTTAPVFLDKLTAMRAATPHGRFVVNAVLVPERLRELVEVKRAVEGAGFSFFPQLMKVKHGVFAYTPEQWRLVEDVVGDPAEAARARTANMAPAYTGRRCLSGARYFVLMQNGDAWSCRSAKRVGEGFLGNAVDGGVRLAAAARACAYTICPCATPANRGMIEGVSP